MPGRVLCAYFSSQYSAFSRVIYLDFRPVERWVKLWRRRPMLIARLLILALRLAHHVVQLVL